MRKNHLISRRLSLFCGTLALLVAFGSGCGGGDREQRQIAGGAKPAAAKVRHLTIADAGTTVKVAQGTTIEIRLGGNVSTGYAWETASLSGTSVTQDGKFTYQDDPGLPAGRAGVYTGKFRAVSPGDTTVNLRYVQPWDNKQVPAKTFKVTVSVLP